MSPSVHSQPPLSLQRPACGPRGAATFSKKHAPQTLNVVRVVIYLHPINYYQKSSNMFFSARNPISEYIWGSPKKFPCPDLGGTPLSKAKAILAICYHLERHPNIPSRAAARKSDLETYRKSRVVCGFLWRVYKR